MSAVRLAGAPVSWGVDFADDPHNPPPSEVLDGIAAAGLEWMELGPVGYLPASPDVLAARGLKSVGTFVFEDLHDRTAEPAVAAAAHDALAALVTFGGRLLVLIDRPCEARAATAGRSGAASRLDAASWDAMIGTIRRVAEAASAVGVKVVVHPHAGSYVEFADEIDRLLADLPAAEASLCVDTGHALYAGLSPLELVSDYGERLEHLHMKDVDAQRHASAIGGGADFWSAMAGGVFCPVGDGLLDLEALARKLDEVGYAGCATIEQDRRPESPGTPLEDLQRSVRKTRAYGIG
jgi:inosose dehydratase